MTAAPEIRLLTLTQPWAALVVLGHKRIETRSWGTPYRGRVAIHAAKGWNKVAEQLANELVNERLIPSTLDFGSILTVEHLTDVVATESVTTRISDQERRFGNYTAGRKAWLFDGALSRPLATPFHYRGAQGLRALPPEIAARLLEAP